MFLFLFLFLKLLPDLGFTTSTCGLSTVGAIDSSVIICGNRPTPRKNSFESRKI